MPGNRFSFAVLIGREVEEIGIDHFFLQIRNDLGFALRHHIEGLEVLIHIHADLRPFLFFEFFRDVGGRLGQIADVTHRGLDHIAFGQEFADRLGLGRGLDDHEAVFGIDFGCDFAHF